MRLPNVLFILIMAVVVTIFRTILVAVPAFILVEPVITSGPPGITGFSGGRPKAQEIIAYWPALIPKELVHTTVDVI